MSDTDLTVTIAELRHLAGVWNRTIQDQELGLIFRMMKPSICEAIDSFVEGVAVVTKEEKTPL